MRKLLLILLIAFLGIHASQAQVTWRIKAQAVITDTLQGNDTLVMDLPVKLNGLQQTSKDDTVLVVKNGMLRYTTSADLNDTLIHVDSIFATFITVDSVIHVDSIYSEIVRIDSILNVDSIFATFITVDSVIHVDSIYSEIVRIDSILNVDSIFATFVTVDSVIHVDSIYAYQIYVDSVLHVDSIYAYQVHVDSFLYVDSLGVRYLHITMALHSDSIFTTILNADTLYLDGDTLTSLAQIRDSTYIDYCEACNETDRYIKTGDTLQIPKLPPDTGGVDLNNYLYLDYHDPGTRTLTDKWLSNEDTALIPKPIFADYSDSIRFIGSNKSLYLNGAVPNQEYIKLYNSNAPGSEFLFWQNTNQTWLRSQNPGQVNDLTLESRNTNNSDVISLSFTQNTGINKTVKRTPSYYEAPYLVNFRSYRGDGVTTALVTPKTNQNIFKFNYESYNGVSNYGDAAKIEIKATENWTDSTQGSSYHVYTTLNGQTSTSERIEFQANGKIQLNGNYTIPKEGPALGQVLVGDGSGNMVPGGSASITGPLEVTAGDTVAPGELLYISDSTGKWHLTDADDTLKSTTLLGIAQDSAYADEPVKIYIDGIYTTTGLDAGKNYYVSTTAGDFTPTQPSVSGQVVRLIGTAISTTQLYLVPTLNYIILQ